REKEDRGKGVVESFTPEKRKSVIEEFQKGANLDHHKINEQWTICVPKYAVSELAGHLRDYVWVTDVVKGKQGETVNIPIVKDCDFQHVVAKTGAFAGVAGLINVITTTLHEAGTYYDAYYGDIEKIDSNMLDELNRVLAHAAIRAEDHDLIYLINTATTGQFLSYSGANSSLTPRAVGTLSANGTLCVEYVIDAIVGLMQRGKEVHPGECLLYVNATGYGHLLKEICGSTPLSFARPDAIQKGLVEDFLGVKVVVGAARAKNHGMTPVTTTYDVAYLMRPKRALALAPKRDILIETDKLIKDRQLRIAASHTFGVVAIDLTEVMPILSHLKTNVIDN
ncbi:MAG: hypothetical protein GTO41_00005, partial [Burkholderiales bacterium]|nr:hypothetical protein [Burkholderiales bacterium]